MKTTPLNQIHRRMGGRMVEFAGWELPVQYKSAVAEHHAVRNTAGVFDVSHMGQVEFKGTGAESMVQRITCNDVSRLSDRQAQYSAFLTPRGTFIDDIVVYRISSAHFLICVNAATRNKDVAWIRQLQLSDVEIIDRSDSYAQIAVQGPKAEEILQQLTKTDLSLIRFYRFNFGKIGGVEALISRTGYTGEDGFELYLAPGEAEAVWKQLFEAGASFDIAPAGLAARNSLRLEMRYALYGNDIDESRTPFEAGLGWIVKLDKEFLGKDALAAQAEAGPAEKLVGFEMTDPGIVRDGYPALIERESIGTVTSGGYSPTLGKSIGLLYVPSTQAEVGQELQIDIRGKIRKARIVKTPFYKRQQRHA